MTRRLARKVAIMTAGASGIGLAMHPAYCASTAAMNAMVEAMHPLGISAPEYTARAAVCLALDESRHATGSAMLVHGRATAI